MTDKVKSLVDEKATLTERLKLLNVQSIGRDNLLQRIEMIDQELALLSTAS